MNQKEEDIVKTIDLLRYIYFALPIHRAQMDGIIEETEQNNLLLGENFSILIDEIGESVRKSNAIKDRLLGSDLSDSHFKEIKPLLSQLLDNSNSVQSSVSEIMVSLQYQDSTKQILTHIQDNLAEIGTEIQGLDDSVKDSITKTKSQLETKIAAQYSMVKEREIFKQVTGIDTSSNDEDDEITFF